MTSKRLRWLYPLALLCGVVFIYITVGCLGDRRNPADYAMSILPEVTKAERDFHDRLSQFRNTQTSSSPNSTHSGDSQEDPKNKTAKLKDAELAARFEQRRARLRSACERYSTSPDFRLLKQEKIDLPRYKPFMTLSVRFCPIQKVASSTWRTLFNDIRKKMVRRRVFGTYALKLTEEKDVSILFVREPYGRLLSAYVDKLFSPNSVFWDLTGRYIVEHFRPNATTKSRRCGHDVTFSEFIQFFIHMQKTGKERDGHFVPTHDHCEMCRHPYTYIGHLETLGGDMSYILKAIHSPVTYTKNFPHGTMYKDAHMALSMMRKDVQNCMDLHEACRRLWKKWQIRGLLCKTQPFPLTREQTRDISLADFVKTGLAAHAHANERCSSRAEQKGEALREAFGSVSEATRMEVKRLLWLDFELLGYDPEPVAVFPPTPVIPQSDFSYFDLYL